MVPRERSTEVMGSRGCWVEEGELNIKIRGISHQKSSVLFGSRENATGMVVTCWIILEEHESYNPD